MRTPDVATTTVTEYGVETLHGNTVVTVSENLADAEHTLELLGEGRLVQRTVSRGAWTASRAPRPPG